MYEGVFKTRPIVGLEIHVQLGTRTKMFCGCPVKYDAPPNSCVCAVCLGHPGSLPVMNRQALHYAVLVGIALNCRIARHTKWDRKSYYYPDLPKNYQISQYDLPLCRSGHFDIMSGERTKRVRVKRVHLEEDAGKNLHDVGDGTLVDLNRAGTPLVEIVTEPDISSGDEAHGLCTELQRLVTYLGVSEGNMQKGQMRFEPNINVAIEFDARQYRTPITEVKNLNSFRSVRRAIEYESKRQVAAWEADHDYQHGKRPNENRGWNDEKGITEFQRPKEAAHDYRYFPDPDLVPVEIADEMLDEIRGALVELPVARRLRFMDQYGLAARDAETIVSDRKTADLFERVVAAGGPADVVGRQLLNVWFELAHDRDVDVPALGVTHERMAELAAMTADDTVSATAARQLAAAMLSRPQAPRELAEELGLIQVRNVHAMASWVDQTFAANEQAVRDALKNPKKAEAAAGFLRGEVMRISGGRADPKLAAELVERRLSDMKS